MADAIDQLKGNLSAARTEAFHQARTTNLFKTLVLILCVAGAVALGIYAISHSTAKPRVRVPFDNKEARNKIAALEKELQLLKSDLAVVEEPNPLLAAAQSVATFAVTNWVLLSFLLAVATAGYVKYKFKLDYFESYRDLATKKTLSEFYRHLGDRMMISAEWDAAEAAYRDSLAINPTNIKATYGIAKASVLQPLKGQTFYGPDIADAKLDYLINHAVREADPTDRRRTAAQLYFLKSINRASVDDDVESKRWLEKAIQSDPTFVCPHLNLGYLHEAAGEFEKAIECYQKAVELEPNLALGHNNLGAVYLSATEFKKAIEHLERAHLISPTLITALALGEAYAYNGEFERALVLHKRAASKLAISGIEKERYVQAGGTWLYGYMPLKKGDTKTIRQSVKVSTFEQKKMVAFGALAFDYALLDNTRQANESFGKAWGAETGNDYSKLFLNRIQSMLNLIGPSPIARGWFEQKATELSSSQLQATAPPAADALPQEAGPKAT